MHIYFKPHDNTGDLIFAPDFAGMVEVGALTPDDGHGFWATIMETSNLRLIPKRGMLESQKPGWATHVMWYNK